MKITKLEYQKKDPNRVNVYVDGKFVVGLEINAVIKLGLHKDQKLTAEELKKIIAESDFGKKFNAALNFLSFRPRSEFEIRQFFRRRKFTDVEPVIEKLKTLGQINDSEFTTWFINQRQTFRPKGKRALEAELRRKGIAAKVVGTNEAGLARRALAKYHGLRTREKLARYLTTRGFEWEIIKDVVERFLKKSYNLTEEEND